MKGGYVRLYDFGVKGFRTRVLVPEVKNETAPCAKLLSLKCLHFALGPHGKLKSPGLKWRRKPALPSVSFLSLNTHSKILLYPYRTPDLRSCSLTEP